MNLLLLFLPGRTEHIGRFTALQRDDVILTGTPGGVSHVCPGDVMRLEVGGLALLENGIQGREAKKSEWGGQ